MITKATLGLVAAISSLSGLAGVNAYMWHRQGDMVDNYVDLKKEQSEIIKLINTTHLSLYSAIRDKEEACEVLKVTVASSKYAKSYCE